VAAALLLVFIGPVVIKLKDVALIVVASIGVVMMLVDIWQTVRAKDE
jgi:hypothetical protein